MKLAVGLAEARPAFRVVIDGDFRSESGGLFGPGEYEFRDPVSLSPAKPTTDSFSVEGFTIGIGFHWQRSRPQAFRGGFRIVQTPAGLTLINDVPLDTYVESVIASEMSADSPLELLKTHAVISRSWILSQIQASGGAYRSERQIGAAEWEILCWYGKESHETFDVCADDHCQRYQGLVDAASGAAARAVRETADEFLVFDGTVCDARFSKCCGGVTENYASAWDDRSVPYLVPVRDGPGGLPDDREAWIRANGEAYCNAGERSLLSRILPDFDQETADFYRWEVNYAPGELAQLVLERTGIDLGDDLRLDPLDRGASGRIVRLRLKGSSGVLTVGKELEIRRILSPSHLYSSAFVAERKPAGRTRLIGAGWGHGAGLCQIGAGALAACGWSYREILTHYYTGALIEARRE